MLTKQQAIEYLNQLQYSGEFDRMVKTFQRDIGLKQTGNLDPQTSLMLMGRFLSAVPTLNIAQFNLETERYMKCEGRPDRCPW